MPIEILARSAGRKPEIVPAVTLLFRLPTVNLGVTVATVVPDCMLELLLTTIPAKMFARSLSVKFVIVVEPDVFVSPDAVKLEITFDTVALAGTPDPPVPLLTPMPGAILNISLLEKPDIAANPLTFVSVVGGVAAGPTSNELITAVTVAFAGIPVPIASTPKRIFAMSTGATSVSALRPL